MCSWMSNAEEEKKRKRYMHIVRVHHEYDQYSHGSLTTGPKNAGWMSWLLGVIQHVYKGPHDEPSEPPDIQQDRKNWHRVPPTHPWLKRFLGLAAKENTWLSKLSKLEDPVDR